MIKTISRIVTLNAYQIEVSQRWLPSFLARRLSISFSLSTFKGAAIRAGWPWSILHLDGNTYDSAAEAGVSTSKTMRCRTKRLHETVAWTTQANLRSRRGSPPGDNVAVSNPGLLERQLAKSETLIARQNQRDESLDGYAMTAVAGFVVLLGLAVNNTEHLPRAVGSQVLYGAGLFLSILGLLTAAATILPNRIKGSVKPYSLRQYYHDHAEDDLVDELLIEGELMEKIVSVNQLELNLKRSRLTREFMALISGAACVAVAFAT